MKTVWALIHNEKVGGRQTFGISFPDFPGVVSAGRSLDEAVERGRETLTFHVAGMLDDGEALPVVRSLEALRQDRDFAEDAADLEYVCVVPLEIEIPTRQVRVNISIEDRLLAEIDRCAQRAGQSRSSFLAEAAREKLKEKAS